MTRWEDIEWLAPDLCGEDGASREAIEKRKHRDEEIAEIEKSDGIKYRDEE